MRTYWDLIRPTMEERLGPCILPELPVEFYPNSGSEVGWAIALERTLCREGWIVDHEVPVSPEHFVDVMAYLGGICLVIEVKARNAGPAACNQLSGYLDDVRRHQPNAIGILAAPSLTATVWSLPPQSYFLPLVRA